MQIKEKIKVPRHWPLWGNSPVTGEFPAQMASNAENGSIWWCHHGLQGWWSCKHGDFSSCFKAGVSYFTYYKRLLFDRQKSIFYLPCWQDYAFFQSACIEYRKLCSNPLAQLLVLLGRGHWAMGIVEPCLIKDKWCWALMFARSRCCGFKVMQRICLILYVIVHIKLTSS